MSSSKFLNNLSKLYWILLIIYPCFCSGIYGFIRNNSTGEPIPYASVMVKYTYVGTTSDRNGYYVIPDLQEGNQTIIVTMMGYENFEKVIKPDRYSNKIDFRLIPKVLTGSNIHITGEDSRYNNNTDISTITLDSHDLKTPPAFIENDIFRTFQLMPGVTAQNDYSASLIVRGGSPDENLVLLDNPQIYNPYHLGGIFSSFNTNAIATADFISGGFPSEYGGNLSAVLNLTTKEGDSQNGRLPKDYWLAKYLDISGVHGELSLLSSNILLEGPLYNGSWFISARRTYFDKLADIYYNYAKADKNWNYFFWDTHFKINTTVKENHKITFSNYYSTDDLYINAGGNDFPEINFYWVWGNKTFDLNWKYFFSPSIFVETGFSSANYFFDVDFQFFVTRESSFSDSTESSGLDLKLKNSVQDNTFYQKYNFFVTSNHRIKIGYNFKNIGLSYEEKFAGATIRNWNQHPLLAEYFITDHVKFDSKLILDSGVRISNYSLYKHTIFDPRISIKYFIHSDFAMKFSWGRFSQFLFTINQDDQLLRIVDFWQPVMQGYRPQKAQHFIFGLEYNQSNGYRFSIETFYKPYSNILDLSKIYHPSLGQNGFVSGNGVAYGIEFFIKKSRGNLNGWLSYTYSRSQKTMDYNENNVIEKELGEKFNAKYDMPNMLKVVANYKISSTSIISLSSVIHSGEPYTPPSGKIYHQGNNIFGSVDNPYQRLVAYYGLKNSSRYPTYFRVDISYMFKSKFFQYDSIYKFQIINLTNQFNVLMYNWEFESSPTRVIAYSMFPLLFTFAMEINF